MHSIDSALPAGNSAIAVEMGKVPGPVMTTEEACERRAGRICRRTGIARTAQKQVCDAAQGAAAPAHAIDMGGAP